MTASARISVAVTQLYVHSDMKGKEVISRYDTDLTTMKQWYTDANGREMQLRKLLKYIVKVYVYKLRVFLLCSLGSRQTWVWNDTAPIAGNYYPINSRIFIRVCVFVLYA